MNTRLDDFVNFHNYCCWNDSIVIQLKAYADLKGYDQKQREAFVLFYAITYCIPSSIVCMNNFDEIQNNTEAFWDKHWKRLRFTSDRRWVKIDNKFCECYRDVTKKRILEQLRQEKTIDLIKYMGLIQKCYFFGRFSAFLFLEAYCFMFQKRTTGDYLDWKNGDTCTSGMMNVLGFDKEADLFDEKEVLLVPEKTLTEALHKVLDKTPDGVSKSVLFIETNLCAYRKLFKQTRYVGYYVDRVQEEIEKMSKEYPEYQKDFNDLYVARSVVLPIKHLGELNGWKGIRKQKCSQYIRTGKWL